MATRTISTLGGNWNATTAWVEGAVPTAADDVVATATSGNLTINVGAACRSIDLSSYLAILTHNASVILSVGTSTPGPSNKALDFNGLWTYTKGSSSSSEIRFVSTSGTQQTIDFGGKVPGNIATPSGSSGGSYLLTGSDIDSPAASWTLNGGMTVDTNGVDVTISNFISNSTNTRVLTLGSSVITLRQTGAVTIWNVSGSGLTINPGTSVIQITSATASTRTFAGHGLTYHILRYTVAGSTGGLDITGSNTFDSIEFSDTTNARTLRFTAGTTQTFTGAGIVGNGASGRLLTLGSITASGHTLSKSSGTVCLDWWSISRSTATGGAGWYAGANSTDGGNNSGWTFTDCPTGTTVNPDTVNVTTSIGTPTLTGTAAPATVTVSTTIGAPTVTATGDVTPDTVTVTTSIGAPTVTATAAVTPATVDVSTTIGTPTVTGSATVTPTTVAVTTTIGAPTITASGTVNPVTLTTTTTIGVPSVTGATVVNPDTVNVATTIGAPSVAATVTPTTVAVTTTIGVPAVDVGQTTVNPATVLTTTTIGGPAIGLGDTVTPTTVLVGITIPTPAIRLRFNPRACCVPDGTERTMLVAAGTPRTMTVPDAIPPGCEN